MNIWSEIVADVEEGVRRRVFGDFGVEDLVVADAVERRDGPIPVRNDRDALRGAYEIALDRVERRRRVLDECAVKVLYAGPLDFASVLTVASDPVSGANETSDHVDLRVSAVAYVESLTTALRDRMEIARRDDASKRLPPRGGAPAFVPLRLATLIQGDVAVRSARERDVPEIMSLQASRWPHVHATVVPAKPEVVAHDGCATCRGDLPTTAAPDLGACREELFVAREAHAVRELGSNQEIDDLRGSVAALKTEIECLKRPIAMFLTCPSCGARHIDEGDFATKVHTSHSCQRCGLTWRPATVPTVGVKFLPGFRNVPHDDGFVDGTLRS